MSAELTHEDLLGIAHRSNTAALPPADATTEDLLRLYAASSRDVPRLVTEVQRLRTTWIAVPGARPADEVPGTPENLAGLARLLDTWRCCGSPGLCGATCQDDELSDALARAARAVQDRITAVEAPR